MKENNNDLDGGDGKGIDENNDSDDKEDGINPSNSDDGALMNGYHACKLN